MKKGFAIIVILLLTIRDANALGARTCSVEWWTNISDSIVILVVSSTQALQPLSPPYWASQQATGKVVETLRGKTEETLSFRQNYLDPRQSAAHTSERRLKKGDRVLAFQVREAGTDLPATVFWLNLTSPSSDRESHAAYNNACKRLSRSDPILSLVKARIKGAKKFKKRGVIRMFAPEGQQPLDMQWEFVVTAEPEYRAQLIKELHSRYPTEAIYNLVSYPGADTVRLIKPYLHDKTKSTVRRYQDAKTITYYPARQEAYRALVLLGEKVPRPRPYYEDMDGPFMTRFEDIRAFPNANWPQDR